MYGQDCTIIGKLQDDITEVVKKGQVTAIAFSLAVPRREPFCNKGTKTEIVHCIYSGSLMKYAAEHYGYGSLLRVQGEFLTEGRYNTRAKKKEFRTFFYVYPEKYALQAIIVKHPTIFHKEENDDYIGFMDKNNADFGGVE